MLFTHKCCRLEQAGEVLVSVPGRVLMNTWSALRCPDIGPLVAGRMVRSLPYTAPPSVGPSASPFPPAVRYSHPRDSHRLVLGSVLLHPQQVLCLHILWERHKGRDSFWYPFICTASFSFLRVLYAVSWGSTWN
jgi:hypothetical protein